MNTMHSTNTMRTPVLLAAVLLALAAGAANADDSGQLASASVASLRAGENASLGVEQRLREEMRAVVTEMIESGAFGDKSPQQIALAVDSPAQRVSNLGLLVDSKGSGSDGLRVLAVTPGGAAERMGVHAGDSLISLNGAPLADPAAATTLRKTVEELPNGSALALDVRRDGHAQKLSGTLRSVYVPAMHLTIGDGVALASNEGGAASAPAVSSPARASYGDGCGRISDVDVAPHQQQLFAAKIISIDGTTPGPTGARSYRVPAGQHVVKVAERIEGRYLSFNDRQRNAGVPGNQYKTLTVDVAPDTTTLIAARFNEDKRYEWKDGAYWDPVAWKQNAETCR